MLVDGTVRRAAGPWTPGVHALLEHLHAVGFTEAPRPLGMDDRGREVLTFIPGQTTGDWPWPDWVWADETMLQAADWLRRYHEAVASFVPPTGSAWRLGGRLQPGQLIAHNDPGPYNAAWDGRLAGFFDWDFAGPATREWELAYLAFAWVPLYSTELDADRGRRLRMLLRAYGSALPVDAVVTLAARRARHLAATVRRLAAAGDAAFARQVEDGSPGLLEQSARELDDLRL